MEEFNCTLMHQITADWIATPRARVLFAELSLAWLVSIACCGGLVFATVALFAVHLHASLRYISDFMVASRMIWLASVFPVTSLCCLAAACVPRSTPLLDMVIIIYFARCLFSFLELVIEIFGGRAAMASTLHQKRVVLAPLRLRWCSLQLTACTLRRLEFLVFQVAIVKPVLYVVTCSFAADRGYVLDIVQPPVYAMVLNLLSTLCAVYGTLIFTNVAADSLAGYRLRAMFRCLQPMILLQNVQQGAFYLVANGFNWLSPGNNSSQSQSSSTPMVISPNTWVSICSHLLLIVECFVLSVVCTFVLRPSQTQIFDLVYHRHHHQRRDQQQQNDNNNSNDCQQCGRRSSDGGGGGGGGGEHQHRQIKQQNLSSISTADDCSIHSNASRHHHHHVTACCASCLSRSNSDYQQQFVY